MPDLFDVEGEMTKIFYARVHASQDPLYGAIECTRFRDRMIVTCAPTVALIGPEVLYHDRTKIRITDRDLIEISDQVEYRITGWDPDHHALIVLLERDLR